MMISARRRRRGDDRIVGSGDLPDNTLLVIEHQQVAIESEPQIGQCQVIHGGGRQPFQSVLEIVSEIPDRGAWRDACRCRGGCDGVKPFQLTLKNGERVTVFRMPAVGGMDGRCAPFGTDHPAGIRSDD